MNIRTLRVPFFELLGQAVLRLVFGRIASCGHRTRLSGQIRAPKGWEVIPLPYRCDDASVDWHLRLLNQTHCRILATLKRWERLVGEKQQTLPGWQYNIAHRVLAAMISECRPWELISRRANRDGSIDWCLTCLEKMTIQCAMPSCGRPIFVGQPVLLYPYQEGVEIAPHAHVFSRRPYLVVGCSYAECAQSGLAYGGKWVPHASGTGRVERSLVM